MYDIDELIEPRKKGQKPRDPFAQVHSQVKEGHGESYQYDVIGQFYPEREIAREYQQKHKGREAHIEYMSPDDYFKKIDQDINKFKANEGLYAIDGGPPYEATHEQVKKYKAAAMRGDKFAMPWIDYKKGEWTGQEGRHRALMAKELGVEKMPVVIVNEDLERYQEPRGWVEKREKEYSRKKKQNPFTYEEELI